MTQSRPPDENTLEAVFADARRSVPELPDGLLDRVMVDALAQMPEPKRGSPWRHVLSALGGWPAMAGLAATACVGIWAGGTLVDELVPGLTPLDSAAFETGTGLGAFDLLLVDG